jgi:mRNA interferase HigB
LVRVIARRTLREFWEQRGHGDAEQPLRAWFAEARRATWRTPSDVKAAYRNASFVGNDRVIFNIGGNKYRLVVALKYSAQIAFIRFVGTHAAYDKIDVEEV